MPPPFFVSAKRYFGDALVIVGGGTGVEHLADFTFRGGSRWCRLDLAVGASRDDGTGGAMRLCERGRAERTRFFPLQPRLCKHGGGSIDLRNGKRDGNAAAAADKPQTGLKALLRKVARPFAFYIRLLKPDHPKFKVVESFFREVVDLVVEEAGMRRIEMGAERTEHAFMNVAIFEGVHFSSVAIVDVTGERPNCFIELGYALPRGGRVLVTAEDGTKLPFDQEMIPCHFWKPGSHLR